jgi:PPOX class probable F420-dependent enzyme
MPSRRDLIAMTPEELQRFLAEQRTVVVGTVGKGGQPHLTALWYVIRDSEPWIFTYARSQKVKNLERDPRATLLIESGQEYHELRGVMLVAEAEIHRDPDAVAALGEELFLRYDRTGRERGPGLDAATQEAVRERAAKRVAIRFRVSQAVTWDHSKLKGTY